MLALALAAVALATPSRPHIAWRPIPFGALRKAQTARRALHHYGRATWRLRPRAIVEHVTATSSFSSVWSAFAADVRDARRVGLRVGPTLRPRRSGC